MSKRDFGFNVISIAFGIVFSAVLVMHKQFFLSLFPGLLVILWPQLYRLIKLEVSPTGMKTVLEKRKTLPPKELKIKLSEHAENPKVKANSQLMRKNSEVQDMLVDKEHFDRETTRAVIDYTGDVASSGTDAAPFVTSPMPHGGYEFFDAKTFWDRCPQCGREVYTDFEGHRKCQKCGWLDDKQSGISSVTPAG